MDFLLIHICYCIQNKTFTYLSIVNSMINWLEIKKFLINNKIIKINPKMLLTEKVFTQRFY
jgi:hypothetical protein